MDSLDFSKSMGAIGDETSMFFKSPQSSPFPPLSECKVEPGVTMPPETPADNMILMKSSPRQEPEEKVDKNVRTLMKDTDILLKFGLNQSKHQQAIHNELRALLDHEKKILLQLISRSTKFTEMKEENKKRIEDWETDFNKRMPFYLEYLKQLIDIPESQGITQEGIPGEVEQRILTELVLKTHHAAHSALVQISLQAGLTNDVELSLSKLRQFCTIMIRSIDNWNRMLNTQGKHQNRVLEVWEQLSIKAKNIKENKAAIEEAAAGIAPSDLQNIMSTVDARLTKLEGTVKEIKSQKFYPDAPGESPPAATTHGPRQIRFSPEQPSPCPPSPPQTFPTGEVYFGIPHTPPSGSPQIPYTPAPDPTYVDGRVQRSRAPPGQFPIDIIDVPGMGFPIPRAAMEKGGRQRGEPIPKTPPTPAPPHYGRFRPMAASSPVGYQRDPQAAISRPTHPQMGQPLDPALLPKIQEELQTLARKNKKLEDLVVNFRKIRQQLTDEMDKAVRLNQKLQRDLFYVAEEASKQPQ